MRALLLKEFGRPGTVCEVPDPSPPPGGVVVRVAASGLCRSDWHAAAGHDPDVVLPHIPGHEFAGVVEAVGAGVDVPLGTRVTAPFVQACGRCAQCLAGDHQVCANQVQPGFTRPGSFAEFVVVENAAVNLVPLPPEVGLEEAALLGCRYATAFRALTAVGRLAPGEWVVVHGCGGVGLSAVQIAAAAGARVVAVDISGPALELAGSLGAEVELDVATPGTSPADVAATVREVTGGGAHLSLDALGSVPTCTASIAGLRPRGRHVQVGLLPPAQGPAELPMHLVVAGELEILGSHGMAAHDYPALLGLVAAGRLPVRRLLTGTLTLEQAGPALAAMGAAPPLGVRLVLPR